MSPTSNQSEKSRAHYAFNLTLVTIAGQVGCLTLAFVLAALFGGLWLGGYFKTRPLFTIGLMAASVPVTLVMMFWVVKTATSKIKSDQSSGNELLQEEAQSGEN